MIRHPGRVPHFTFSRHRWFALAMSALLLAPCFMSCAVGVTTRSLFGETMDLHISVDSVANNEYPLAMTMIYVYDEDLFKKLLELSAKQWYDTQAQIREEDQDDSKLETYEWEWIPGQDTTVSVPLRSSTAGAIIFVNYFNDGQHRVRVEPNRDIDVEMGFDDVKVVPTR